MKDMIWRKWKFWLALLVGATCVGLLEGAQVYAGSNALGRPLTWARSLGSTMPSWYVLAALVPAILWTSRRYPLEPGRWPRSLLVHAGVAVLFAIVHITAASWLSDYVLIGDAQMPWDFRVNLSRLLSIYFVIELFTYFALVGGYHAWEYGGRYHERERTAAQLELRATRLEASLAHANLDSLRMQLNPHFLFNTLNAISVMAMKGEKKGVVRMLTLLSDLLRLSLERREQVVSLREELDFLDRYLEIEQVRFRDRLTLERDIEPEALDAEVPSLLLQPLVENAIRHGISRCAGPGTVRLEARQSDSETLELRVLDTGTGPSTDRPVELVDLHSHSGTGVGLANTCARLEHLYGDRQSLVLADRATEVDGVRGAVVTVRLPFRIVTGDDTGNGSTRQRRDPATPLRKRHA